MKKIIPLNWKLANKKGRRCAPFALKVCLADVETFFVLEITKLFDPVEELFLISFQNAIQAMNAENNHAAYVCASGGSQGV